MLVDNSRPSARQRAAGIRSGQALFGALAATISLLRWLLLALAGVYLCSGITRVAPNEDALIYRLGRLQDAVHPPGLLLALPAPIDRVVRVPTRTQQEMFLIAWSPDEDDVTLAAAQAAPAAATTTETSENSANTGTRRRLNPAMLAVLPGRSTAPSDASSSSSVPAGKGLHPVFNGYTLTGDANIVQTRFTLRYRIVDPRAYAEAIQDGSVSRLLDASTFAAATQVVAGMNIDEALGSGLESMRDQVRELAQKRIDQLHVGIELVAFEVNLITPPQATVAAFADVTSAQVEARTALEQARTYRAQTIPRARSDAFRLRQQADADARQSIDRASGESQSFLALLDEYRIAPDLVTTRMRAETLEAVLPKLKRKTVLPQDGGHFNLYLQPDTR